MKGPLIDNPQFTVPFWQWFEENKDTKVLELRKLMFTYTFFLRDFKDLFLLFIKRP